MADKSQNININWKYNTQEVERGTAILTRANQAANNLQQSAQKGASAITQEFQKSNRTILDMQTALTRLKSVIEVTSNPAKLKQLSNEYKNIKTQLDAATKSAYQLDNAIKSQGTGVSSLSSKFGQLYGAVQAVVGAAIIRQVVSFTLEMARLAGQTEGVERAFGRAFPNATQILTNLRNATKGTISDFELMQRTLQATNLGVSVQQLPRLFEFAAARAQQTGESVDYLVDSIVRGIGRKSPLILDNLGISAIRLKEKFNGAALASQSVGDVTKAVAEIAEEELTKIGGFAETSATKVDQLTVAWEKAKTSFSERFETSGAIEFFTNFFDTLGNTFEGRTAQLIKVAKEEGVRIAETILQGDTLKSFQDNQQAKTDFLQQEINTRVEIEGGYNDQVSRLSAELLNIEAKSGRDRTLADNQRAEFLEREILRYKLLVLSTREARISLKAFLDQLSKDQINEQIISIQTLRDELKALQEQREEQTSIGNKSELDRLQREIMLMEDRILKIADNIKWQKQWDRSKEESALASLNEAEAEKELEKAIEAVNNRIGEQIGKAPELKDSMDELEASIKEVSDTLELTTSKEFLIRLRLGFQGKGGDASELQKMVNDQLLELRNVAFESGVDLLHAEVEAEANALKARLKQTEDFYANQQLLAGDNEKAKKELRIKEERETARIRNEIARKEKQSARMHILIDVATGIAKALATYPWPYSLIPAAAVAAQGAIQLAIVNKAPANFAEGVIDLKGPGTSKSDSIPANLSRGESVMTAKETRYANQVLKDVRAKKLDDRILRDLRQGQRQPIQVLNDERIIKAIKDQKPPDVVKIGSTLYDVRKQTETYKKRIRNSSLSI